MSKIERIVTALSDSDYEAILTDLKKSRADNSLFILEQYRAGQPDDAVLTKELKVSSGSLYTLKSRLFDRIQSHLSGNIFSSREQVLEKLHEIPARCFTSPREVAVAFLLKLEQDLKTFDLHNELVVVYSALKKLHVFTDRHFLYSQLYNQHIAYSLSVEKSEELLGSFNRSLAEFCLNRSKVSMETMHFLLNQVEEQYTISKSRQILISMLLMRVQLQLLTGAPEGGVQDLLAQVKKQIEELPQSSSQKQWVPAVKCLHFVYYLKMKDLTKASAFYTELVPELPHLLLAGMVARTSAVLPALLEFYQRTERLGELAEVPPETFKLDASDEHADIQLALFGASSDYFAGNLRQGAAKLNEVLNRYSFREKSHAALEIRLLQVFLYICLSEFEYAGTLLKNLSRKLKETPELHFVSYLVSAFTLVIKNAGKVPDKAGEQLLLFNVHNKPPFDLLAFMMPEFSRRFAPKNSLI